MKREESKNMFVAIEQDEDGDIVSVSFKRSREEAVEILQKQWEECQDEPWPQDAFENGNRETTKYGARFSIFEEGIS
jgi:hypothetical protein